MPDGKTFSMTVRASHVRECEVEIVKPGLTPEYLTAHLQAGYFELRLEQGVWLIYEKATGEKVAIIHNMAEDDGPTKFDDFRLCYENEKFDWRGCEVVPIDNPANPIDFGYGPVSSYWRINFPDQSWIHVPNRESAIVYIDVQAIARPDRLTKPRG